MSEENKEVVRRYFEDIFNQKNFAACDELMGEEYVENAVAPFRRSAPGAVNVHQAHAGAAVEGARLTGFRVHRDDAPADVPTTSSAPVTSSSALNDPRQESRHPRDPGDATTAEHQCVSHRARLRSRWGDPVQRGSRTSSRPMATASARGRRS